jgi:plastocyanin
MDNELLFYVFGIGTAVSAVAISFIALKVKGFPGRAAPVVILYFAVLVVGATTFSVLHAQDEEHHKEQELAHANEIYEGEAHEEPGSQAAGEAEESGEAEETEEKEAPEPAAKGPGGELQLAADPSAIAYDKTELTSKPGNVTIDFTNPAPLEHDVVVEDEGGAELAASEVITEGKSSATGEFAAGTYTFFCSVPGHREAGMEGTLSVK